VTGEPLLPAGAQLVGLVSLALLLGWVVRLVRRQRLGLRESLLWIASTSVALLLLAFPSSLWTLARLLDVKVPANGLFAVAFLYVLVNILSSTISISRNADRTRRLAQECAAQRAELGLLRAELERLRAEVSGRAPGGPPPG
jgi:hypothetical protein